MMALWGNLNICPHLDYLELLYHTSRELLSISHLKIWGDVQEPRNDMAYLLVHTGDALGAENYGMALVWISPHQVQMSTMEEAVGRQHLGILPQGKVEESPYGWISQLKVCQLLSARPRVVYPVGLNGGDQPVTITLPEQLHSGSSITTNKHPHMRIDIPLLPPEEPECTTPPLDGAHAIPAATQTKTPWKPRISLATDVDDLLIWAMAGNSSCESEHSATGKAATVEIIMSLSHKSEAPALPIDSSSQASMEEGKASLESNPVNISPIAAMYSSCSASPLVDLTELQMGANLAANHMLSVKRSMDLKRQRVIWELGLLLWQNEAEKTASNEKAKVVHS